VSLSRVFPPCARALRTAVRRNSCSDFFRSATSSMRLRRKFAPCPNPCRSGCGCHSECPAFYEQAEIFRAELEQRLADLEAAQKSFDKYNSAGNYPSILVLQCAGVPSEASGAGKSTRCAVLTPASLLC